MNKNTFNNFAVAILIGSFVIAMAIVINGFMQIIMGSKGDAAKAERAFENIAYVKVNESPVLGNINAPVTVVEYTDFECPICKQAFDEILPQLRKEYIDTNKVKLVFKSLPVEYLHKTAFKKTKAAFCAGEQGGYNSFYRYYYSLFQRFDLNPAPNPDAELNNIAQQNGLNTGEFRTCLDSGKYEDKIKKEILEANLIGSRGTPTWLIGKSSNGGLTDTVKINGLIEYPAYKIIIDDLLGK